MQHTEDKTREERIKARDKAKEFLEKLKAEKSEQVSGENQQSDEEKQSTIDQGTELADNTPPTSAEVENRQNDEESKLTKSTEQQLSDPIEGQEQVTMSQDDEYEVLTTPQFDPSKNEARRADKEMKKKKRKAGRTKHPGSHNLFGESSGDESEMLEEYPSLLDIEAVEDKSTGEGLQPSVMYITESEDEKCKTCQAKWTAQCTLSKVYRRKT